MVIYSVARTNLHVSISLAVSRNDFLKEYENNPVNLRRPCDFCKKPHPRYMRHPEKDSVVSPEFRYLPYHQCLPGCDTNSTKPGEFITHLHNAPIERSVFKLSVLNHSLCFKPRNNTNITKVGEERGSSKHSGKSFDKGEKF